MITKRNLKNWKVEEITTKEFETFKFHKPIDFYKTIRYTGKQKGNKMSKVKKESVKQSKNLFKEAKLIVVGISNLAFVVAESISAYILWFSGNTVELKIVAGVLVVDASVRACKQFVNR
jgi:hypothetical protein